MTLQPGATLGPYEVVAQIGAGGMGEVYRACDTRLKRDVALKVLPDAFSRDPDRRARFQREAEVLATLSHPNIAQIYGLQDADGVTALVMELVEGPTLADRLSHVGRVSRSRPAGLPIEEPGPLRGTRPTYGFAPGPRRGTRPTVRRADAAQRIRRIGRT